jgi:hypothetical protein
MTTIYLRQCCSFTKAWVERARVEARHGRKDSSRDVLRFVRGACIVQMLKEHTFEQGMSVDVGHLEWLLRELENDVHPSSVPDFRDDFTAIRSSIETLAQGISMILKEQQRKAGPGESS